MAGLDPDLAGLQDIPDPAANLRATATLPATAPAEPSLTRQGRRARLVAALVFGVVWVLMLTLRFGLRADLGSVAVVLGLWTAGGATALVVALHPGATGVSVGARVLVATLAAIPAAFVTSVLASSSAASDVFSWPDALRCLEFCALLVAVPLCLSFLLFTRAFAGSALWRSALVGVACGLMSSIGCHAHCAIGGMSHVLVAHGLPVVIGGVAGALFGALRGRS